jgi:general secretion pathway protein M
MASASLASWTGWRTLRAALAARFGALAPREQRAVQVAVTVLGLALAWWVLLAPALDTLQKAPAQRVQLEQQRDRMLALQLRAQALQAQATLPSADALQALESAVAALGSGASLQVAGDVATVRLQKVNADALAQWLVQPATGVRLQPVEARWVRDSAAVPSWSGTLVYRLPAGETRAL